MQVTRTQKSPRNSAGRTKLLYRIRNVTLSFGGTRFHSPSDVSNILTTGVDSFIGVHMLATSLAIQESTTIYILGTYQVVEISGLIRSLQKYRLLDSTITEAMLLSKVRFVPGTLVESYFGLSEDKFKELGRKMRKIYHLGGHVSLLKSYTDLKRLNVSAVLDVIELVHEFCFRRLYDEKK